MKCKRKHQLTAFQILSFKIFITKLGIWLIFVTSTHAQVYSVSFFSQKTTWALQKGKYMLMYIDKKKTKSRNMLIRLILFSYCKNRLYASNVCLKLSPRFIVHACNPIGLNTQNFNFVLPFSSKNNIFNYGVTKTSESVPYKFE